MTRIVAVLVVAVAVLIVVNGCSGGTAVPPPVETDWATFRYSTQPFDMGVSVFEYTGTAIPIRRGEAIAVMARWDPAKHSLASAPEVSSGLNWRTTGSGTDGIRALVWSEVAGDYAITYTNEAGTKATVRIHVANESYPFRIFVQGSAGWTPAQESDWPHGFALGLFIQIRVEWTIRPEVEAARPENVDVTLVDSGAGWDVYDLQSTGPTSGVNEVVDVHIGGGDWIRLLYEIL